jgi:hypothetical protein
MVSGGSWTGKAADAFTTAWDKDSTAGTQLAEAWTKIGSIAQELAEELASLESELEGAAYQLEKQGVPVDPATGKAEAGKSTVAGPVTQQTAAARSKLASEYMTYRAKILNQATQARMHATNALYTITEELLPPQFDAGQLTNGLDGIRGLWALPTDVRREVDAAVANKGDVRAAVWDELLTKHKVSGYNARLEKSTLAEMAKSDAALAEAEANAADAPPESILTKLFSGDAEGLGAAGVLGKAIEGVPYIGATAGAVIQVIQDREDHESWAHSLVDGVVSNAAALGAGIGVAALFTAGTAAVIGGGSFVAVGVGAAAGAVAAVGVGDAVHNLIQENWGQDIDQHGVLGGLGHGTVDSLDKTRHDLAHYGDDIKNFF